ncbi:hypothetical protein [Caballeronia arvi]|nr:hypothetical protein [Caballeronia arvi]
MLTRIGNSVLAGMSLVALRANATSVVSSEAPKNGRKTVSLLDYYANGVSGAFVDRTGTIDSTRGIQKFFNDCGKSGEIATMPAGRYKISGPLTYSGAGGILMESAGYGDDITGDCGIFPVGSNYTALTVSGSPHIFDVTLGGGGQNLDGILFKNPQMAKIGKTRVYNFNGAGVRIDRCWDCLFETISVELCGNAGNYAFSMNDAGDTCNMSHILRLQVEQAQYRAIFISPNSLSCVIDNIHSERAKTGPAHPTWVLGGNRCRYNGVRLHALVPTTASATFDGANTTFANVSTEGAVAVRAQGYNGTSITFDTPSVEGSFGVVPDQVGIITIVGGSIANFNSNAYSFRVFGTRISSLTVAYSNSDPEQMQFFGCSVGTLRSVSTTAAASFTGCTISESGSYLADITIFNNCSVTSTRPIVIAHSQKVIGNNSNFSAGGSGFSVAGNGCIISRGSTWNGAMSFTGQCASLFDETSSVSGAVKGFSAPSALTWIKGARTRNIAPAVGSPKGWVCVVAGIPGTWISEGNL